MQPILLSLLSRYQETASHVIHARLRIQVLAIPLPRRPLFPGNIMPVSIQNPKLVKELMELKKDRQVEACVCVRMPA